LAKQRQGFGSDLLEPKDMLLGFGIFGIAGLGPTREPAHHALDFADRAAVRRVDPSALGLGRGDASELAHRGPTEAAGFESVGELRQVLQRSSHTQSFFGDSRRVPQYALGVFGKT